MQMATTWRSSSRLVIGAAVEDYVLATEDILTNRTFPDTISHHRSNFDAGAHPDTELFLLKDMKGPVFTCDLPYRCVTPKGLEGILMTGLGASTTRDTMTLTRMQPDLQNQGYVGIAASMAVLTTGGNVREIDLKALQKELVKNGCLKKRVLTDTDAFPLDREVIAEAVKQLNAAYHWCPSEAGIRRYPFRVGCGLELPKAGDPFAAARVHPSIETRDQTELCPHSGYPRGCKRQRLLNRSVTEG